MRRAIAPGAPALDRLRHWLALPLWYPAGGRAPGAPALDRLRYLFALPLWYPAGARGRVEPARHWLSLPRGRGPSQTPKFLSPGPPSPWLPALLIGKPFCRFCVESQAPMRRVPVWQGL